MLRSVWSYRIFILSSIFADLRGRYARSRLGALWLILHPFAQALIFAIVLSEVLGARLPGIDDPSAYPVYLLAGMSAWTLFTEILNRSMTIFLDFSGVIKKIAFPKIALPIIVMGTAILNHVILLFAIAIVAGFLGYMPGAPWLLLPVLALVAALLGFGIGLICGVLNVFSRDIGQVMSIIIQLWFWLTPIVYPIGIIPSSFQWLVRLNPMTHITGAYQDIIVYGRVPDMLGLGATCVAGLVILVASYVLFKRAQPDLIDAL
jgi:lipopolysaccharide transport system permease protein